MTTLSWSYGQWRYNNGVVEAYFGSRGMVEIPVGKCRRGAFYLIRTGEDSWQVAPVRFPKNRPETYDIGGHYSGFLSLVGGPPEVNDALSKI